MCFVPCGFRLQSGWCTSRAQNVKFCAQSFDLHRSESREGDPPKKPPTQIKRVCTNSLCKQGFCLFSAYFKGKRSGQFVDKTDPRNCLCKLFVQTLFIWVGGFLGGSRKLPFSEPQRSRTPKSNYRRVHQDYTHS